MSWLDFFSSAKDVAGPFTGEAPFLTGSIGGEGLDFLSGAGDLISAGGKLAGLFGASEKDLRNAATPQFAYRPMEDALRDTDLLRGYLESRTQPIVTPTRQLTAQERGDDVFSPKAVMALEDYVNARGQQTAPATQDVAPTEANSIFPNVNTDVTALRRLYQTDPNDMSAQAQEKRRNLFKIDQMMRDFKDGDVNPYTGEKFDLNRQLGFYKQQADFEDTAPRSPLFGTQALLSPEQAQKIRDEQDALYYQTYQPSKSKNSFLGKFGVPLALSLMGAAPAMFAGAGLGASMAAAPVSASNVIKGASTLARGATGK